MDVAKCTRLVRLIRLSSKKSGIQPSQKAAWQRPWRGSGQNHSVVPLKHQLGAVNRQWNSGTTVLGILLAVGATLAFVPRSRTALAEEPHDEKRLIRLADIHAHNRSNDTYWVYRGDRVYDITDWIPNHPGGEVILRAVGGSIEPYWNIFTIHQKQEVYEILEQYFIGKIDPRDLIEGRAPTGNVDDPFTSDPKRDASLLVHSSKPCNAETPVHELDAYITPLDKFFVRNHLWVPDLGDAEKHRLTIELMDGEEVEYSVADLRSKFREYTVTATLQCSGNRRSHMTEGARPTNGLQWGVGAISTARWTGVKLRDVLADAGLDVLEPDEEIKHAQFVGAEAYGASIPIDKAVDRHGDVMLVYAMNGKSLPRDHGFPLRVLVPGHVAARSVKWLKKIILSDEESSSQWQKRDYKCFGPNISGREANWDCAPAIQETPVQCAITAVRQVDANRLKNSSLARVYGLEEESVVLEGYAFAGGGRSIVRVDVSPDDGKTWQQAQLMGPEEDAGLRDDSSRSWAWKQWRLAIPSHLIKDNFCAKAVDDSYNTQPDAFEPQYNFRGNLSNGWHRVPVTRNDGDE